ncbi:hypothetical protein F5B22DRAFT_626088 [Xylaria bambusicola]|uniref:uncharacterized protein n=1 Tax=Xylaria bambusicola TaxID=326684 RepID=UPI0020086DB7|nr:uncharacterized protein F5B22DRAFT_626088 [Xylaria bambusicola]KAI0505955.1 hypothetical protein F5B22DRAFT_626088 [Xylaria bambusicola]
MARWVIVRPHTCSLISGSLAAKCYRKSLGSDAKLRRRLGWSANIVAEDVMPSRLSPTGRMMILTANPEQHKVLAALQMHRQIRHLPTLPVGDDPLLVYTA